MVGDFSVKVGNHFSDNKKNSVKRRKTAQKNN